MSDHYHPNLDGPAEPVGLAMKPLRCVQAWCDHAELIYLKDGDARQTKNGLLIAKINGWYCPVCAGSYGGRQ